jgi:hypothetical protein
MTIRDLYFWSQEHPRVLILFFGALPLLAEILGIFVKNRMQPNRAIACAMGVLVYLACIPGMFALMLTGAVFLFDRQDVRDLDLLVTILPIASMGLTLGLLWRRVDLQVVPGFERLSGLMVLLGVSFGVVFILSRFFLVGVLHGSITALVTAAAVVFAALKLGSRKLFK